MPKGSLKTTTKAVPDDSVRDSLTELGAGDLLFDILDKFMLFGSLDSDSDKIPAEELALLGGAGVLKSKSKKLKEMMGETESGSPKNRRPSRAMDNLPVDVSGEKIQETGRHSRSIGNPSFDDEKSLRESFQDTAGERAASREAVESGPRKSAPKAPEKTLADIDAPSKGKSHPKNIDTLKRFQARNAPRGDTGIAKLKDFQKSFQRNELIKSLKNIGDEKEIAALIDSEIFDSDFEKLLAEEAASDSISSRKGIPKRKVGPDDFISSKHATRASSDEFLPILKQDVPRQSGAPKVLEGASSADEVTQILEGRNPPSGKQLSAGISETGKQLVDDASKLRRAAKLKRVKDLVVGTTKLGKLGRLAAGLIGGTTIATGLLSQTNKKDGEQATKPVSDMDKAINDIGWD